MYPHCVHIFSEYAILHPDTKLTDYNVGALLEKANTGGHAAIEPTILVVEDNRDLAQLFAGLLEVMGFAPVKALNGTEAIEKALQIRPDIIFCDLAMPGEKDGYEVARIIKATPSLRHAMLIAVTGTSGHDMQSKASQVRFDHVMTKPVQFRDVQKLLTDFRLRRDTGREID